MSETIQTHTIDEALAKFDLIEGKGDGKKTACVMSAISWVAGEAFTDAPSCAHRLLRSMTIAANDADGTATIWASIGIELDEAFCEIAAKRLAQGVLDFGGIPA